MFYSESIHSSRLIRRDRVHVRGSRFRSAVSSGNTISGKASQDGGVVDRDNDATLRGVRIEQHYNYITLRGYKEIEGKPLTLQLRYAILRGGGRVNN